MSVTDVQKYNHYVVHSGNVISGNLSVGDKVTGYVDEVRRKGAESVGCTVNLVLTFCFLHHVFHTSPGLSLRTHEESYCNTFTWTLSGTSAGWCTPAWFKH